MRGAAILVAELLTHMNDGSVGRLRGVDAIRHAGGLHPIQQGHVEMAIPALPALGDSGENQFSHPDPSHCLVG